MKKRKIIGYSVMSLIVMVLVVASVFAVSLSGTSETETQKNYSNPQKTAIGGAVSETEMKFTDVSETAWYYNDVKNAYELGLINGRSEVLFVPEGNLTYAEAAKLAACMYQVYTGDQVIIAGGNPWYQVYVDYCLEKGIVLENHDWQADITRGAYMDIFSRALPQDALVEINRIDPDMIPDVNSGYIYAEGIYCLYRAGIAQGMNAEHNCQPESLVKRSEVAAILTRMMDDGKRITFSMVNPGYADQMEDGIEIEEEIEYVFMNTPAGEILMSDALKSILRVEEQQNGGEYTATVYGNVSGKEKMLFTISFGSSEKDGYLIGSIDENEVRINVKDVTFDAAWSEDDIVQIQTLQNEVNTVIMQIYSFAGFKENVNNSGNKPQTEDVVEYEEYVFLYTQIGEFYLSEKWKDNVYTEQYSVNDLDGIEVFGCTDSGEKLLYTMYLGDSHYGYHLGYVNKISVSIEVAELDFDSKWSSADCELIQILQDEVNNVIVQIQQLKGFTTEQPEEIVTDHYYDEEQNDNTLHTPIGQIHFSEEWNNNILTEMISDYDGYAAAVYGKTESGIMKLFSVYVGGNMTAGHLVGYVNNTAVRIEVEELKFSNKWSEYDRELMDILQQEVNTVIMQVNEIEGFSMETPDGYSEEVVSEEYTLMNTPVGEIRFAEKWKDNIRVVKETVSTGYAVTVYGRNAGGEMELFTLAIGCGEGTGELLGMIGEYDIRLKIDDLQFTGTWSEEDKTHMYVLQDEVNTVIMQFYEMDGFVAA